METETSGERDGDGDEAKMKMKRGHMNTKMRIETAEEKFHETQKL